MRSTEYLLEECFVIRRGCGYMTIADTTVGIGADGVTYQGIGEGHGLHNPGPGELEFLRIAVAVPGEEYTTIDLNDNLAERRPTEGCRGPGGGAAP